VFHLDSLLDLLGSPADLDYMPCSRIPVSPFPWGTRYCLRYLIFTRHSHSQYLTGLNHFTLTLSGFALRPTISLSTLRHGRYLPLRKTRYGAPREGLTPAGYPVARFQQVRWSFAQRTFPYYATFKKMSQ